MISAVDNQFIRFASGFIQGSLRQPKMTFYCVYRFMRFGSPVRLLWIDILYGNGDVGDRGRLVPIRGPPG